MEGPRTWWRWGRASTKSYFPVIQQAVSSPLSPTRRYTRDDRAHSGRLFPSISRRRGNTLRAPTAAGPVAGSRFAAISRNSARFWARATWPRRSVWRAFTTGRRERTNTVSGWILNCRAGPPPVRWQSFAARRGEILLRSKYARSLRRMVSMRGPGSLIYGD